jgi:hypothetical protein
VTVERASLRLRASRFGVLLSALLTLSSAAGAQTLNEPDPRSLEIHGFVSQGFIKSTKNNYLAASKRGSLEFTEAGINFTKPLTDQFRVGLQLFAHDLGPLGNYNPQFDWFYLDYRFRDWFGVRAGRIKIPFGLYNDSSEIDAARAPILLPQSIYQVDHREYLLAQTGGEIYGRIPLGGAGALEYRGYGGTLSADLAGPSSPGVTVSKLEIPYVIGSRLMWQPPIEGLQLGGSFQALRFDANYGFAPELATVLQAIGYLPADYMGSLPVKFRVRLWVGSLEYVAGDLSLAAEYSRWVGEFESAAPLLLPPHTVNERYYAMGSYHLAPWFTPGMYYSAYYPNIEQRAARESYQRDAAVFVRYDINSHWLLKVEGHYMSGTAALDRGLNDGKELHDLEKTWGVFLLKTTAYF